MIFQEMGTLRPILTPNFTPLHPHIQGIFLVLLLKTIPNYSKYFILQWLVCWFGFKVDQMLLFEEIWQKGMFFPRMSLFSDLIPLLVAQFIRLLFKLFITNVVSLTI